MARQNSPSITSGLKISVQPPAPASPIVHVCEQTQQNVFFVHTHNSCTRNGDNLILLIKTDNDHKKECRCKPSLKLLESVRGRDCNTVENDDGGQMLVAFTVTETNNLVVSLLCDLVRSVSYLYLRY